MNLNLFDDWQILVSEVETIDIQMLDTSIRFEISKPLK